MQLSYGLPGQIKHKNISYFHRAVGGGRGQQPPLRKNPKTSRNENECSEGGTRLCW